MLSISSCSSNSEGNTTPAIWLSSSRLMWSTDSERGDAEASKGDFKSSPRYFVRRSLIPLPLPSLRVQVQFPVPPERCAEIRFFLPSQRGWNRHATGAPHHPEPVSTVRAPLPDRCAQASCSGLLDTHIVSAECWALWNQAEMGFSLPTAARDYNASAASSRRAPLSSAAPGPWTCRSRG